MKQKRNTNENKSGEENNTIIDSRDYKQKKKSDVVSNKPKLDNGEKRKSDQAKKVEESSPEEKAAEQNIPNKERLNVERIPFFV